MWIQAMSELEPRDLKTDREVARVVRSPDGKFLCYTVGTRIMKISLDGGESQAVCDARGEFDWGGGAGISWGDDGTITFSRGDSGGVFRVPAVGGDPRQLIKPDTTETDFHDPAVLPGGRGVIFAAHKRHGGHNNITRSRGRRGRANQAGGVAPAVACCSAARAARPPTAPPIRSMAAWRTIASHSEPVPVTSRPNTAPTIAVRTTCMRPR